ncbi:uncharacterized protein LOC111268408 [Varroa jacobsoni]|uniref:Insulin-like domain-containing protein n=1 Tax=Varroa destructor TaxID=109461 RepID=A0A7M7M6Q4_VARDE|nr:uncharacterized protein LOC111247217 [Varroa destructor]XP_022703124.1 uncharacterized protein LOC111268408 [Varroa jacobsoni]
MQSFFRSYLLISRSVLIGALIFLSTVPVLPTEARLLPTVKVCNVDEFYDAMTIACSFPPIQAHKRADYDDSVERNNMDLESFSEQCCQKQCSIGVFMHLCNKHDLRRK